MGTAVGISLLSRIEAEIHVTSFLLPVNGRHLSFPAPRTSDGIYMCTIVFQDPENLGAAIGIPFLSCVEAKI